MARIFERQESGYCHAGKHRPLLPQCWQTLAAGTGRSSRKPPKDSRSAAGVPQRQMSLQIFTYIYTNRSESLGDAAEELLQQEVRVQ